MTQVFKRSILSLLISTFSVSVQAADLSPIDMVKRADAIKSPLDSYFMKASITSSDQPERTVLELAIASNDKAKATWLEPSRDAGRKFLMLGEELWVYLPNLKRAVRSSLNQKLTGLAANGDICRMQWSQDYDAKLEKKTPEALVLFLQAKKKGLTYDKIRVWLKPDYRPMRAEYLTVSSKVLKTAVYTDYKKISGSVRPTRIEITDALNASNRSTIRILEMEPKSFPDSIFQRSSL